MLRLVFAQGASNKFWECTTRGAELHIRFGKVGSAGTMQIKKLASAAEAASAAQKLGAQKRAKGYVEDKVARRANPSTTPTPRQPTAGPAASVVVSAFRGDVGAAWQIDTEIWFAHVFGDDEGGRVLAKGGSLADAIAAGGEVERWRFESVAEARAALAYVRAHAAQGISLKGDTSADPTAWSKRLGKKEQPRIARFGAGNRGPLIATRDRTHPWIHARVPSTSYGSGRLMVPVWSLVGPLDERFGKQTGVFLSTCPQQVLSPYHDGISEVIVQTPAAAPFDAWFTGPGGSFETVHLSRQCDPINESERWAVTRHSGDKSSVGWYRTTHEKTFAEAQKAFTTLVAELDRQGKRQKALGSWYPKILDEITRHNRVPGQKPATIKLDRQHAPMLHASSTNYLPSRAVLARGAGVVGGAPSFCQESWDFVPKNPASKSPLLALASFGSGDAPLWSEVLNDGDAGTFNVWAAPGDPFGVLTFSCH